MKPPFFKKPQCNKNENDLLNQEYEILFKLETFQSEPAGYARCSILFQFGKIQFTSFYGLTLLLFLPVVKSYQVYYYVKLGFTRITSPGWMSLRARTNLP
jgi:hypothetical protein